MVAKCGVFLKEKGMSTGATIYNYFQHAYMTLATHVEGIFRLSGSAKRIQDLQAIFNSPVRYGKGLNWTGYTVHDAANILRRYLNQLPEPIVPFDFYERFRDPLRRSQTSGTTDGENQPVNLSVKEHTAAVLAYQKLITELPALNRQLLLYTLDLLAVFASASDLNRMTAANLAAIFQSGIISHPTHDMSPNEFRLSQDVLIFLIENQENFLVGMSGTAIDKETRKDVESGAPSLQSPHVVGQSTSNASPRPNSLRKFDGARLDQDLDIQQVLKDSEEDAHEHEHGDDENSDEEGDNKLDIIEPSEQTISLRHVSAHPSSTSASKSSDYALAKDLVKPAWWPRTKVGQSQNKPVGYMKSKRREWGQKKAGTTFAHRRAFSRKLAESCQKIQGNSPAAAWHQWPAKLSSATESTSISLVYDTVAETTEGPYLLQPLMEYGQKLCENWSTLLSNLDEDFPVTGLAYDSRRNVVSVVKVNREQTVSLQSLIKYVNDVFGRNGNMGDSWHKYKHSDLLVPGSEVETGSGLFSIIEPWNGKFEDLIRYLQMTLQAIDLAMLSHLNAHASIATRESSEELIRIPAQPTYEVSAEKVLLFQPYRLACLNGLARGRKVWVFHRKSEQPREPLYLSTSVHDFAAICGPLWAVPTCEEGGLIDHYNVGGGQLYPVRNHDGPQLLENERRCHWRKQEALYDEAEDANSTSSKESEPDRSTPGHLQHIREAEPLKDDENLLIGAIRSPKMKWYACRCSMSELKSRMRGSQQLHPLRSRGWYNYVSSTSLGLALGTSGVVMAGTVTRQTDEGQSFKQGFLEEWENSPRSWNPRDLMDFRGLLVPACSFNARRVRLVDLLKTDTLSALIDRCHFNNGDTRKELTAALEDPDPFAIVDLWERNTDLQDDLGNAFLVGIRALCKSGYDARHQVFNVLWKPPHERKLYRLELRPREHPWLDLLKDSEDTMTMAVLVEDRLATHSKDPCGRDNKPTILETAIVINRSLSPVRHLEKVERRKNKDPPPWRSADRRWNYIWKVQGIPTGTSLRLPEANRLKAVAALTDTHLLLEQTPALIQLIKDALKIKSVRKDCHWEYASDNSDYDSAGDDIRPVPVHVR